MGWWVQAGAKERSTRGERTDITRYAHALTGINPGFSLIELIVWGLNKLHAIPCFRAVHTEIFIAPYLKDGWSGGQWLHACASNCVVTDMPDLLPCSSC